MGPWDIRGCARASISRRLTCEITCRAEDKRYRAAVLSDTVEKSLGSRARTGMKRRDAEKSSGSLFPRSRRRYSDGRKSEDKSRANTRSRHERFSVREGSLGSRITCLSFEFSSRKNPGTEKEGSFSSEKTSSRYPETVGHCLSDQSPLKRMGRLSCRWKRKIWRENSATRVKIRRAVT